MRISQQPIISLASVDSTNNYAANLLNTTKPAEGTAIMSRVQTAGKGQRGKSWNSRPGENLLCSIILYPDFLKNSGHFELSKCVALAIHGVIEEITGTKAWIKWPNDIIVHKKKIAGILIEATWSGQIIQAAIAGIGFNVNQAEFDVPQATSIFLLTGRHSIITDVLQRVRDALEIYYEMLRRGETDRINTSYLEHLYQRELLSSYIHDGQLFQGTIKGVDLSGKLIIATDNSIRLFSSQEVSFV